MPAPWPDPIGHRIAIDRVAIGFLFVRRADNTVYNYQNFAYDSDDMKDVNNEDSDVAWSINSPLITEKVVAGIVFTEETWDVGGYFAVNQWGAWNSLEISRDSTDGVNGHWTAVVTGAANLIGCYHTYDVSTKWRDQAKLISESNPDTSVSTIGIKGVRFVMDGGHNESILAMHFYGHPFLIDDTNRTAIWDPVLDDRIDTTGFNFDDCPHRSSADRLFRVKNTSIHDLATAVTVTVDSLTPATTGTPLNHHQTLLLSKDQGQTFAAAVNIGTLSPGEISDVVILRRVTPDTEALQCVAFRVIASGAGTFFDGVEYGYFGDVSTNVPVPHLWFLFPTSGHPGDPVTMYGLGWGNTQAEYNGIVAYGGVEMPSSGWSHVPASASAYGVDRKIQVVNKVINVEYQKVTATTPYNARDDYFRVETDA